jgi:putative (di)nucleoside polyphosphate hydrolase
LAPPRGPAGALFPRRPHRPVSSAEHRLVTREDLEAAARRELYEETGVTSAELIARTEEWIAYDFPADYGGSKQARGWSGQKQQWFAFRFTGEESEIDLEAHGEIEFDAWRWGPLSEAPDQIVPFKRVVYEQVVAVFAPLVV